MNDADSCEQGFKEQADKDSSIGQKTVIFGHLCSNVLAVTNKAAAGANASRDKYGKRYSTVLKRPDQIHYLIWVDCSEAWKTVTLKVIILAKENENGFARIGNMSSLSNTCNTLPFTKSNASNVFEKFHATNARGLIKKACETSLHKGLCVATLKADTDYKGAKLHDLAEIVLKAATSNATALQKEVGQFLKERADTSVESALKDCKENYDDAVSQLEKSKKALENKRYNDVNTWVTAAMNDADSCEQGFKEQAEKDSPIAQKTVIFGQLCSNVLAVTNKAAAGANVSI
ncbi:hypothetical protein FEM48_Zijuj02G0136600 [Ziziphus jujuba var. spinosa]|uniref:Pectinesterase inhibitor domain-containing protein n=1 Tax=Ziziphus jujuba var. spinosa TaxID=714518 RepID=A0A978VW09_ZIZJJ|nr:hypothetical protein FEM48_Zijuj02G0136600 [Ziziphus jujuba var. spinosa]